MKEMRLAKTHAAVDEERVELAPGMFRYRDRCRVRKPVRGSDDIRAKHVLGVQSMSPRRGSGRSASDPAAAGPIHCRAVGPGLRWLLRPLLGVLHLLPGTRLSPAVRRASTASAPHHARTCDAAFPRLPGR